VSGSKKPDSLITIHDIGMNQDGFQDFLTHEDNIQLFDKYVVYHIELPGQHKDAEQLPPDYLFSTLPNMATEIVPVLEHFALTDVIGLGVGAGAAILLHLAMAAPDRFLGVTVIDPSTKSIRVRDWTRQKLAAHALEKSGFTGTAQKFLMRHLFGTKSTKKSESVDTVYKSIEHIALHQNSYNLSQYVKSHMARKDMLTDVAEKLRCFVLIVTSAHSPYKKEAHALREKLDFKKCALLKSSTTVNAFFDDVEKCAEGMLLMMQGCGLAPTLRTRRASCWISS